MTMPRKRISQCLNERDARRSSRNRISSTPRGERISSNYPMSAVAKAEEENKIENCADDDRDDFVY